MVECSLNGLLNSAHLHWPGWSELLRVLSLRDFNTRVVMLGTTLLGMAGGLIGTFLLLRKQSLVGDVISHATLPGIGIAFLVMEVASPGTGKWLPGLLLGASVSSLLGVACFRAVVRFSRVKDDAALAIVLSVFFGLGIALFTVIQSVPSGNAAGLHQFIFGKAAALLPEDVALIAGVSTVVVSVTALLFKELLVLSFDSGFAAAAGYPTQVLDAVLMLLVVAVTVIGLQSVGLLLVVAMLIIPAAAARFWVQRAPAMAVVAALIGGIGAWGGVVVSALFPRMAAGAIIVLVTATMFGVSMLFGRRNGVVQRWREHFWLRARTEREHLLRAFFELVEARDPNAVRWAGLEPMADETAVSVGELVSKRRWTRRKVMRLIRRAIREGLVQATSGGRFRLTRRGLAEARRVVRNHRLWELYLIRHADLAPALVDRSADAIEHVLSPEIVDELAAELQEQYPYLAVPPSPHATGPAAGDG
ncbi:MAG: iron ABC transporter [Planctomycetota bacterium]|nr:MAG: iron ABC transporter [Planctomycetota bacterium]